MTTRERAGAHTILFVHPSDELYGSDRVLLEIVQHLPDRYRAVVVLPADVAYHGELSGELRDAGAEVHHVDMAVLRRAYLHPLRLPRLVWRFLRGTVAITRLARRERAEIVHSNTIAVLCGASAALVSRRPHLWDVHETISDEPRPIRALLRGAISRVPGVVVTNSLASARAIVAGSARRARRTSVIYYGVVDQAEVPAPRIPHQPGEPLSVGFVGRLVPRKGIAEALEAVALVHRAGIPLCMHIYGTAPPGQEWREEEYRRQARALDIDGIVTFHGFVPDVRERLGTLDVMLVPSQRPEPFGRVLVEGMLAGCIVVACRNGGGSDEILEDGVTGLYCERDPAAIAGAIERLASDDDLRIAIAAAAPPAAIERYSIDRFALEMAGVYDQLCGGRER